MTKTIQIGDIFSIPINENEKKHFQYIADDISQLNSNVIRAFSKIYAIDEHPFMEEIISSSVDFYAHCIVKYVAKFNQLEKVGNTLNIGNTKTILFRGTNDYGVKQGEEPTKKSSRWYVWHIGEEFQRVGELKGENRKADIGIVANPYDIVKRIKTGEYNINYPEFD